MTGCSVEVRGWSSGSVGTISSGVLVEDLFALPRVTRDVGPGAAEECEEGVILEDLRGPTEGEEVENGC